MQIVTAGAKVGDGKLLATGIQSLANELRDQKSGILARAVGVEGANDANWYSKFQGIVTADFLGQNFGMTVWVKRLNRMVLSNRQTVRLAVNVRTDQRESRLVKAAELQHIRRSKHVDFIIAAR